MLSTGIHKARVARRIALAGATAAATAAALVVAPSAAANPESAAAQDGDGAPQRAVQAMAQDLDISHAEAEHRVETQSAKAALADRLRDQLGSDPAGAFIRSRTGQLVVNVTNADAADRVRETKAQPEVVDHSLQRLREIKAELQDVAVTGSTLGINVRSNEVAVTIPRSASGDRAQALLRRANSFGGTVDVSRVDRVPRTTVLYGGEAIHGGSTRCSAAFVTTDGSSEYVVTAGHCTQAASSWTVDEGNLGSNAGSNFPGNDYGLINNSGGVQTSGSVQRNGSPYDITGAGNPPVGTQVCKTGSTTGTSCGTIDQYDVTVNYQQGTVTGLIQTDVCVQPGDSGGAMYTSSGNQAVGIASGGSTGNCGAGFTSFFENITDALSAYGVNIKGTDGGGDEPPPEEPPEEGTWETGTAYQAGDQVTYDGQEYECLQAHTAQTGWEPPNTPALWQPPV